MEAITFPSRFSRLLERWFWLGLVLFFVLLSVQYSFKVQDTQRDTRSAFLRWRVQILDMDNGVDIWQRYNYPNPPIMAMLLKPLVMLPPLLGSLVWFYLKVGMALAAIYLTIRLVETPGQPWPAWAKALAVILSLRPIMGDLSHGNVNLFIMLLCVFALACFRSRRDLSAGVALALAVACKVTPALLLPYFLWKRSYKLLAGCGIGLVLFFWLIPGLFFGFEENQAYLVQWYKGMIQPYAVQGVVTTDHENQSLPGLVHRMLTESASFSTFVDDQYVTLETHNLVSWDPAVARIIVKMCMAVFAGLVVWVCRNPTNDRERWQHAVWARHNPTNDRQRWQLAAEYSVIFLGMLLFSERTWKHHCVTLLVPFCVLSYYLATVKAGRWQKCYLVATLAAAALLMASTSTGWSRSLERVGKLAQVYGAYVWANLALTTALVVVLRHHSQSARQATPPKVDHIESVTVGCARIRAPKVEQLTAAR